MSCTSSLCTPKAPASSFPAIPNICPEGSRQDLWKDKERKHKVGHSGKVCTRILPYVNDIKLRYTVNQWWSGYPSIIIVGVWWIKKCLHAAVLGTVMLSDFKLHKRAIGAYEICRVYKYNYSHSKLLYSWSIEKALLETITLC